MIRPCVPGRENLPPTEALPPPATQLREDGAPHPGALCCCGACLGRAALPRDWRYAGATGWALEVEGAAPSASLSHYAPSPAWKREGGHVAGPEGEPAVACGEAGLSPPLGG